jgi:phosphatidylglycerol:prolipoprotein diacylglycerol transferase
MLPYIHIADLHIPFLPMVPIHPFGLLVATGVLVGTALANRRARLLGYDLELLNSFITWMLLAGFIGAHVLDEIFYHPEEIARDPLSLLYLWKGISSFGGFLGASIGILLWKYFEISPPPESPVGGSDKTALVVGGAAAPKKGIARPRLRKEPASVLAFADLILAVFPVAWIFGRSGCTVVHDHPGAPATAADWLAVAYPSAHVGEIPLSVPRSTFGPIEIIHGTFPRYDLGILELLFTIFVALAFAITWKRVLPVGSYVVATALTYAPTRFVMDFYRITRDVGGENADPRYGQLTFAQWCCVALFVYGIGMIAYIMRLKGRGVDLAVSVRATAVPAGVAVPSTRYGSSPL